MDLADPTAGSRLATDIRGAVPGGKAGAR